MSKWSKNLCQAFLGAEAPEKAVETCEDKLEKQLYTDLGIELSKPEEETEEAEVE